MAKCQWNERSPFYAGTFYTDKRDGIEFARREAARLAVKFFEDILPVKVDPPDTIRLVPGIVIIHTEEE